MKSYGILLITFTLATCLSFADCGRHAWFRSYGRRRSGAHSSSVGNHGGGGGVIPPVNGNNSLNSTSNLIVQLKDGALRGFTMRTVTGRAIDAFQGIPFAQPPVGDLRFRDPVKNLPWNGTRDAIAQAPQCIQLDLMRNLQVHGQEDCLYLNVYRPQQISRPVNFPSQKKKLLPVMVWIHGGGFFFGSASIFGPAYLLDQDIILVSMNYRIGPFGFLSTGDNASPGNQGLKDQVLALKWVQKNIAAFGGDPTSVTVFGESAGAVSIQHHITSPMSRGLFHRGISQSGSGMCYWSILENSTQTAMRVGELLNCTGTSQEMINCLRGVDAESIAPIQLSLADWNLFPVVVFGPVVEHNHRGAFMIETPEQAYKNNRALRVPWITGFNKDEMVWLVSALIQDTAAVADINNDWDRVGPIFLGLVYNTTENNIATARQIRQFYMGDSDFSFETRHQFAQMFGDRFIVECGLEAMRYHARFTGAPTYSYRMSYEGRYSVVQLVGQDPEDWGVAHLDELIYLFNNTDYYTTLQPSDEEFQMSRIMTSIWTNFASFGRPFVQLGGRLRDIWQPIQQITTKLSPVRLLDLNLKPAMIADPYAERYAFWRRVALID